MTHKHLLFVPIAVALLAASPAPTAVPLAPEVSAALGQLGHNDAANLAGINAYIAMHPDDGIAYSVRCSIALHIAETSGGDRAESLGDCAKGANLAPTSALAHLFLADALYDNRHITESLAEYTKAVDLGMTGWGVFSKRCDAERRTGNLAAAMADCDRQVQLTPDSPTALYARGVIEYQMALYPKAIDDLTAAGVRQGLNRVNTLYWRGLAYAGARRFSEAETDFTQAIALGDQAPDTYFHRGQARQAQGKTDLAFADYQEARKRYASENMTDGMKNVDDAMATLPTPRPQTSPQPR